MRPSSRAQLWSALSCVLILFQSPLLWSQGRALGESATLKLSTVDIGEPYADLTEVDLNGDGRKDLLFTTQTPPLRWRVAIQVAPNEFTLTREILIPNHCAALALADWDNQPGEDIVALSAKGYQLISALSGSKEPRVSLPLLLPPGRNRIPKHWAWGEDVTGDGHQDLLLPGRDHDWLVLGRSKQSQLARTVVPIHTPAEQSISYAAEGMLEVRTKKTRAEFAHITSASSFEPVFMTAKGLCCLPRGSDGSEISFSTEANLLFPVTLGAEAGLGLLRRTDVDLADFNHDGKDDLVLTRTEAIAGVVPSRRTDLLFFLNQQPATGVPTQVLRLPGVLSNGPDLVDVNGDGLVDLVLSVFAGDVKSEISRRLLGRVRLEWHIYLGLPNRQRGVVQRSPSLTIKDQVPLERFQNWGLRHRRVPIEDWNGDGIADLVAFMISDDTCEVSLTLGSLEGKGSLSFAGTHLTTSKVKAPITDHSVVTLAEGMPSARLKSQTAVRYLTLDRIPK